MGHGVGHLGGDYMEPLLILFLLPALIGVASELMFRDARHASIAATLGSVAVVGTGVQALGPDSSWNWLATLLVLPLPISFALAAVIILYGRSHVRARGDRHEA